MKNNICIISRGPVGPDFNGGAMTVWGLATAFAKKKNVNLELLIFFENRKDETEVLNTENYFKERNIKYRLIFFKENNNIFTFLKNFFQFNYSYFFNTYKIKKKINTFIKNSKYDLIYAYHFDSLSLIDKINKSKTIALLGDQMHEPRILRREVLRYNILKRYSLNFIDNFFFKLVEKQLIKNLKLVGYFANYYTLKKTLYNKFYIRTTIEDNFQKNNFEKYISEKYENNIKNNDIVLLGALHGTVTLSGLIFLKKYLLKYNSHEFFDFYIIGKGNLIKKINIIKKFKNIKFIKRVEDLNYFLSKKKILLVPNTIILGIRVRIITALMYGLVVITHKSNLKGIPELNSEENCLVFNTHNELDIILKNIIMNKIDLKQISKHARITFEKHFNHNKIVDNLFLESKK